MKKYLLAVFTSAITGISISGFGVSMVMAQLQEKPQETVNADDYDICSGYLPGRPELETAGIFLCKDRQDNQIYEVFFRAEDVGELFFDSNKDFIAHCGMFAKDPYPGKCGEILKYSCDRTKDLMPELCGKESRQSYTACGCGCCGGVEPTQECLYHSKGDDMGKIIEADKAQRKNPICKFVGCSRGTKYVYCD